MKTKFKRIKKNINFFNVKLSNSSARSDLSLTPIKEYNIRFNHII